MSEQLCFQEFGIRKNVEHVIDPSVIIQIEESIIANQDKERVTGILFGKQLPNNLVVSAVLITPTGTLSDQNEFKTTSNFESLLKYYEKVMSLSCVGLFAKKGDFDFECYLQNSSMFQFKKTTDVIFLTADFNESTQEFDFTAFSSLRNKFFKEAFVVFQKVPIRIDFVEEEYLKSRLKSDSRVIFLRRE